MLLTSATLLLGACGGHSNQNYSNGNVGNTPAYTTPSAAAPAPYDTTAQTTVRGKHHSVLGGAAAGALAGHYMGHHALLGAAAGAMIQHHRNKKAGY